jgi:OPA family sugar phosphate sensor protein UhpC-like MFS transporter
MRKFFATGADAPPLSDPATIDQLFRRHRFRIMVAVTLGYGMSYTCRLALGVVKKPLIDAGVFTPTELGLIGSALFYAYAFGKLTNGFLADHANMKRFFAFSVLISAIANLGMGFSTTVALSAVVWGINGWFQSFGAPAGVVSMSQWFSNRERGRYYGIWSTAHSIGEGLTFVGVGGVVAALGWRYGFWGPALVGTLVAIGGYLLVQDRPQTLGLPSVANWRNDHWQGDKAKQDAAGVFQTQLQILKIPAVWALALSSALIYVTRYAINSWGVLYLQEAKGYSLTAAGSLLMISTLAGIVGAISFGFLSDKLFKARRPPANLLFGLMELAGLCLIFYGPNTGPVIVLGMILFGAGMTALVTSLGGLFATDICPKRVAGAALGLVGVFSYLGAAIQEQISGALIEKGLRVVDGVRHYDFGPAIVFWIGASVASLTLATCLWRTKLRD